MPTRDLPAWAEHLDLQPHPEGGWYAETYRHDTTTETDAGIRSLGTAIYFLLLPGESSAWHRVVSDELWFHHRGGPLRLWLGGAGADPGETTEHVVGATPQPVNTRSCWCRAVSGRRPARSPTPSW